MNPFDRVSMRIREVLDVPETGPTLRRFFINTMFDSTFVILGILIGSAFSDEPSLRVVIVTIITSSVALGISTGVSVFEAESMEQKIKLRELEAAMLIRLDDTHIYRVSRFSIILISAINFVAPIISGTVTLMPFLLMGEAEIRTAAWISVSLAITVLFVIGAIMGRSGERNPWVQGARMSIAGVAAFIICYFIESIL